MPDTDLQRAGAWLTWALPLVLLFGAVPGWWNAGSFILAVLGTLALVVITKKTPPIVMVAQRAMSDR